MPGWLKRLVLSAVAGVPIGAGLAFGVGWWCLEAVDSGRQPIAGQLHVREGWCWTFASDQARGLAFYNLEREPYCLLNHLLDHRAIPWWADPPDEIGPPGPAKWRVGTLAVGWPWPALARQWSETELDFGFLPPVDRDDDGSTIGRAADRFRSPVQQSRWIAIPAGIAADIGVFAAIAAALVFVVLARRAGDAADESA